MPLPTIIYAGTAFAIFIIGMVLYLTSTDFKLEDILSLLPRTLVSIQKHIDKRKIGALALVIIGLLGSFTFSDRLIAEAANPSGGGGPSLVQCPGLLWISCFSNQNSTTICTAVNVGTSGCPVKCNSPMSVLQCGTAVFGTDASGGQTVNGAGCGSPTCTVTFATPFASAPKYVSVTLNGIATTSASVNHNVLYTIYPYGETTSIPTAMSFDTSAITGDAAFSTNPFSFTVAVTPGSANEYAVLVIAHSCGAVFVTCFSATTSTVSSVTDTQSSVWHLEQSGISGDACSCGYLALYTAKLATTAADTITINYANPGLETDNAGASVSLYKGVGGIGPSAFHTASATSDSVSITTTRANDFVVGGSELSQLGTVCDAITVGAGQTQRRVDSVNCAANKIVNFDLQDKLVASVGSTTFTGNYAAADGDAIAAVELVTQQSPNWQGIGTSDTELFGDTTHESQVTFQSTVTSSQQTLKLWIDCALASSPGATLTFTLYASSTTTATLSGTASSLCNGVSQGGAVFNIPATPALTAPMILKAKCSGCGNGFTIEILQAYFVYAWILSYSALPEVLSITATSFRLVVASSDIACRTCTFTFIWEAVE